MNYPISPSLKFKHDTVGKLSTIKDAIEALDEMDNEQKIELLLALKDSFEKMEKACGCYIERINSESSIAGSVD